MINPKSEVTMTTGRLYMTHNRFYTAWGSPEREFIAPPCRHLASTCLGVGKGGYELIGRMKVLYFLKLGLIRDLALYSPSGHYQEAITLITTTTPPTRVHS